MRNARRHLSVFLPLAFLGAAVVSADTPKLGEPAAPEVVAKWNSTIFPDGRGLPEGKGTVTEGRAIYDKKCSNCHGPEGRGETAEELAGNDVPLSDPDTSQTIGSYWPYATTLFDYTRRAMPMDAPGSLAPDEVYAVTAYLLQINGVITEADEINAATLAKVRMPNRDGFTRIDAK
jgi:cytochrome c